MSEHVTAGSRDMGDDAGSKPLLSRYARRASKPTTGSEPESVPDDLASTATHPVEFEISARTTDLPGPNGPTGEREPATSGFDASVATVEETRAGARDPATAPDVATAVGSIDPLPAAAPVESRVPSSAPATPPTPARPRAGADDVRRVEASEVREADRAERGWMSALIPIPEDPPIDRSAQKKIPFWKRIALPRAQAIPPQASTATPRPLSLEPILTRLNALEKQLAANQSATESQLARFEENITRLWELEEQLTLTEVRERLALLEANQQEIADALHTVARNLTLLAVVLAAGLVAGLLAVGLLL